MESAQAYKMRVRREQSEIKVRLDNKRQVVLKEVLLNALENDKKLENGIVEEYNSITKLPF